MFLSYLFQIEQDFVLLFEEGTSATFLERWPTTIKQKIINLSKATKNLAESAVDGGADTNADG
jgi:hypothetical protein